MAKNLGSKKTGTIHSAQDERNEVPAKTSYRKPWKSEPMPWNTVNCRLFATVENPSPQKSHNALDKHLGPVKVANKRLDLLALDIMAVNEKKKKNKEKNVPI